MKIMCTGSSGFIGGYVVERLLADHHEVIAFDRTDQARYHRPVRKFLGDTRDFTAVHEAVALSDGVIHLAGVLGTAETINEPRPAVETNVFGGLNVFQACRNYGVPCAYITVGNYWMQNSYSITKTTAERFAYMFNKEHGTKISVVRALNAYGPRQKAAPVRKIIPNFVLPCLKGEPITVYGDGEQVMDMIHVRDVAEVMVRALFHDHGVYDRHFDAGTGRETTVNDIAEAVIKAVGKGSIKHVPMRPGEPEHSKVVGDPDSLEPLFGKVPDLRKLEDELPEVVEYYKK